MSDLEEGILKHTVSDSSTQLMHIRKRLLILHSYYQQLSDFCEDLEENSNHFFQAEECQIFSLYASRSSGFMTFRKCSGICSADPGDGTVADRRQTEPDHADSYCCDYDLFPALSDHRLVRHEFFSYAGTFRSSCLRDPDRYLCRDCFDRDLDFS